MSQDIKAALHEWSKFYIDRGTGYPRQSAFVTERVQTSNRSTETYHSIPADIVRLNDLIESLAPLFRRIVALQYRDRRPQRVKAEVIEMEQSVFSQRLNYAHEQLAFSMWGE